MRLLMRQRETATVAHCIMHCVGVSGAHFGAPDAASASPSPALAALNKFQSVRSCTQVASPVLREAGIPIFDAFHETLPLWQFHMWDKDCTHFCFPGEGSPKCKTHTHDTRATEESSCRNRHVSGLGCHATSMVIPVMLCLQGHTSCGPSCSQTCSSPWSSGNDQPLLLFSLCLRSSGSQKQWLVPCKDLQLATC